MRTCRECHGSLNKFYSHDYKPHQGRSNGSNSGMNGDPPRPASIVGIAAVAHLINHWRHIFLHDSRRSVSSSHILPSRTPIPLFAIRIGQVMQRTPLKTPQAERHIHQPRPFKASYCRTPFPTRSTRKCPSDRASAHHHHFCTSRPVCAAAHPHTKSALSRLYQPGAWALPRAIQLRTFSSPKSHPCHALLPLKDASLDLQYIHQPH